jgi:hypothetical protein
VRHELLEAPRHTRVIDLLRRSGRVTSTKTLMVLDTWTAG